MNRPLDIVENFGGPKPDASDLVEPPKTEAPKLFLVARFQPARERLLLKRLPPPEDGLIVKPQIAQEQSEYGYVIAKGRDVEAPVGVIAKFSKYSGPEEIHFDDEEEGDEFVLVFEQDIRGWLRRYEVPEGAKIA